MDEGDRIDGSGAAATGRRYCANCGAVFGDESAACPRCLTPWSPRSFTTVPALATLLTELRWLREDGVLNEGGYAAARALYEKRLESVMSGAQTIPPGGAATGSRRLSLADRLRNALDPAAARRTTPPRPSTDQPRAKAEPTAPPRPPRQSLGEWAAERQADILLYLGAFILCIAALIFVGYQGEALTGEARFGVLLLYTLAFLGLGLTLPRWDRVREAGPVFLVLGALLVPVNFIALRTQVLDGVPCRTMSSGCSAARSRLPSTWGSRRAGTAGSTRCRAGWRRWWPGERSAPCCPYRMSGSAFGSR